MTHAAQQKHAELMTKQQVLGSQPAARFEQVDENILSKCRVEDHAMILPYYAKLSWMEFSERTASNSRLRGQFDKR
jgi:hypothetical protein